MTPKERYLDIRNQTETFQRKAMMKHQILLHIGEAVLDERRRCMEIVSRLCTCNQEAILAAMSRE